MEELEMIRHRIFELRGQKVILDRDLAALYGVETKALNLAVKRNERRFPGDFMLRLTKEEWDGLRSQYVTINEEGKEVDSEQGDGNLRFQFETSSSEKGKSRRWGGARYLPYAFTEQGVAMLSGVINSERAIEMNISIMRTFVAIRHIVYRKTDLLERIQDIKQKVGEHDAQITRLYDMLEDLLDEKAGMNNEDDDCPRIGF